MADALTFEEFVTTRSPAFLRLAYALTRNHSHAEDLLQTTLARTWPAWKRISGDPEPYVRRVLVNTHNSWWRRRWNGEHATGELPEPATGHPQSTVDDRDEVWRALARLPKRQRAVLVLRFFEDLSEAQIAETLGMAPLEPAGPAGYPRYIDGHEIVAGSHGLNGDTFTWTPGSLAPHVWVRCFGAGSEDDWFEVALEFRGHRQILALCGGGSSGAGTVVKYLDEDDLRGAGVELGRPVPVRIVLIRERGSVPPDTSVAIGIGEPVPWESYPFPRKPVRLKTLDRQGLTEHSPGLTTLLETNGARSMEIHWDHSSLSAQSQAPGLLHIYVNGELVQTLGWWDYNATIRTTDLDHSKITGSVTLTIVPEHGQADWIVAVRPQR